MEENRKDRSEEIINADVVVISDDENDIREVTLEARTQQMETVEKKEYLEAKQAKATVEMENQKNVFHDRTTLSSFITRYCSDIENISDLSPPSIFSPTYIQEIVLACYKTPYSLYLYVGVELDDGRSTSAILIGYLDQTSGLSVIRLLDTFQLSVDTIDPATDMDLSAVVGADCDAHLLIERLKNFNLPLSNLCVFFCNTHPAVSPVFESQLQVFSPRLVSLCGLPGMAGRACQAGLLAAFSCVVVLIRDVHHHYSTCPSVDDSLKVVFADAESYSPSSPLCMQSLFIIKIVQKMVSSWRDLLEYFKSLSPTVDVRQIKIRLMDHKFKLQFQFLSHTLHPLRALQQLQEDGNLDVAEELQLISMLLQSYATSILRPSATIRFLREWNLSALHNEKELLAISDVDVGSSARDSMSDLGEQEQSDFLNAASMFYKAALKSLVESVPKNLGAVALLNISKVLKHPEDINVRTCHFFEKTSRA